MLVTPPKLELLLQAVPLDNVVRIEMSEGVPIFRALPSIHERVEELLEKLQTSTLTTVEKRELLQYEELDEFLSLVNRLVRNLMQGNGNGTAHAPTV